MTVITTASGRQRRVPAHIDIDRIAGLDPEGRIVVDDFDARNAEPSTVAGLTTAQFMFGLTLCCDAYDKGVEDGVVCRACYGEKGDDVGSYLYRDDGGGFPILGDDAADHD